MPIGSAHHSTPKTSSKGRNFRRRFSLQPLSLSLSLREEEPDTLCNSGDAEINGDGGKTRYKVVVLGSARVGKTALIHQFLYDAFPSKYKRTVEEMHHGQYELAGGTSLTLDILDTSGAFEFPAMRALSITSADAFVLVFALNDDTSWEEVRTIRDDILATKGSDVPIVIVGNKSDQPRVISKEMAESVASVDWEHGYVECSAKENTNILQVFKELLSQAKVKYNLSPAVRRRRQSLPQVPPMSPVKAVSPAPPSTPAPNHHNKEVNKTTGNNQSSRAKRNSCMIS